MSARELTENSSGEIRAGDDNDSLRLNGLRDYTPERSGRQITAARRRQRFRSSVRGGRQTWSLVRDDSCR